MYRHLLIAVDGSLLSESAFKKALVFAKEMNATVTLLRAIPEDHLTVYQAEMLGAHQPQHTDQARKNATAYLEGLETEACHALVPCNTAAVSYTHLDVYKRQISARNRPSNRPRSSKRARSVQ